MSPRQPKTVLPHMPTHEQRAWAAGFWDGEGCTSRRLVHRTSALGVKYDLYSPVLHTAQIVDGERMLNRFSDSVGGLGHVSKFNRVSPQKTVDGDMKFYRSGHQWNASDMGELQTIMGMLWPYLSGPKKDQFKSIMAGYKQNVKDRKALNLPVGQAAHQAKLKGDNHIGCRA